MAESPSQPRTEGYGNPRGEPRLADRAPEFKGQPRGTPDRPSDLQAAHQPQAGDAGLRPPEPRSFGADDIEGARPAAEARRFADYGGQASNESDRLPPGVSRTPAEDDRPPSDATGPGAG